MTTLLEELNQAGKMLDKIIYQAFSMLMEKWNMNNGVDGFAEFYATHPRCRFEEQILEEMVLINLDETYVMSDMESTTPAPNNGTEVTKALNDSWLQQQYARWFEGNDRFLTMSQYHMADEEKLFFNWLIRK